MTNDELKTLCESNARAIQATNEQIAENDRVTTTKINNLADIVQAFIAKLDSEGLKVTLVTQIADDIGGDVAYLEQQSNRQDVSITALRESANADRQAFGEQAEADRAAFREEMAAARAQADSDRAEWQSNFTAQMEAMRSQLVEMSRINRRLDNLEQAG